MSDKLSLKQKKKIIKDLASFYGVQVEFEDGMMDTDASVDLVNEIICMEIDAFENEESLWISCFFHELAHIVCKHMGKYKIFHSDESKLTKREQEVFLKTAWKAESYTDKIGSRMFFAHFPDMNFHFGYTKEIKKHYQPIMLQEYKDYFNELNKKQ